MVIRGHTELLLQCTGLGDPLRRYPEDIMKATERAARLTRQLLAFGRKQVLQPRVMDLNRLVAQVAELLPSLLGRCWRPTAAACAPTRRRSSR